ncbi:site-specific integrase [Sphingomonas sp. Ag1]|jgi:integrase|uniref:site-specific integrase n=1 Tax=Sphingomonas sp. Ag1 TaxID=1642949 RepID=UPI000A712473|nr:site-specific integrase [Sphingomonas sp. Ag1]
MVQMATPWLHPDTGVYYLRRQIPKELRPAFGGKALEKQSLRTKDVAKAAILFLEANAKLERQFEEARRRLRKTGSAGPSLQDQAEQLVLAYFNGPEFMEGGLDGAERLELARIEVDRGLWNETENGMSFPQPAEEDSWWDLTNNAAMYRGWNGRRPVQQHPPGTIWHWRDDAFAADARSRQIYRVAAQIARFSGIPASQLPPTLAGAIASFFNDQPVSSPRERRSRPPGSRLRPDMRMTELFGLWKTALQPSEQTAHEYEQSLGDFIEMFGDVRAAEVTPDDLLDYRDEALKLPRSMPRVDRALPFTRRVAKHETTFPKVKPPTLKKRVGAIQAFLAFAFKQKWIATNVGVGIQIEGYSKTGGLKPNSLDEAEIARLFAAPLFTDLSTWRSDRKVSSRTLYWLFLLALTTGARIEELGQALLTDVKVDGDVIYIDVDDYVTDDEAEDVAKSVKNANSRRVIPVHDNLKRLGFQRYASMLRDAGEVQLFPDLTPGRFGKRTKEASRASNRLIDKLVSKDRRLRFHSFRHQFKDFALEAGITDRVADQITGHAPTTIGGRYGSGVRLPALSKFLHQINWSFVDWSAIRQASSVAAWNANTQIPDDN